jgi:hypothetical protein
MIAEKGILFQLLYMYMYEYMYMYRPYYNY